jgi:hypothetical protein
MITFGGKKLGVNPAWTARDRTRIGLSLFIGGIEAFNLLGLARAPRVGTVLPIIWLPPLLWIAVSLWLGLAPADAPPKAGAPGPGEPAPTAPAATRPDAYLDGMRLGLNIFLLGHALVIGCSAALLAVIFILGAVLCGRH